MTEELASFVGTTSPPLSEDAEGSMKSLLPDFLGRDCGSTIGVLKTDLVWKVFVSIVYSEYL